MALLEYNEATVLRGCPCAFLIMPFDVDFHTLKSDKYIELAEGAQLDFGVRCGSLRLMRRARCAIGNG